MADNQLDEDTLKEAIKAAEHDEQNDRTLSVLGDLYYDRGEFQQAIVYYEKAKGLQPDKWIYQAKIGDAYRSLKDWDAAIRQYKEILDKDPHNDNVSNKLGIAYYFKPDYPLAIQAYLDAVKANPQPIYYVNLGDAYRQVGNLPEAEDYYQNAAAMDEAYAPAHNGLGIVHALMRRTEQAIVCFERAIALEQTEPVYFVNLGDAYRFLSQWEKAIDAYSKAINLDPDDPETLNSLGVTYSQLKEYEQAIACYQRAMKIEETALYNANLGSAYRFLGDLEKATTHYRRAIELDPQDDTSLNALGVIYYRKGKHYQAIQQYQKAIEINRDAVYFVNVADSYQQLGKLDKAIENYQLAIDLAGETGVDSKNVQVDLGLAYNEVGIKEYVAGNQEKALEYYRKALELLQKDDAVYHNIYLSLKLLKRYPEAEANLNRAIELNPTGPDYQAELDELKQLAQSAGG